MGWSGKCTLLLPVGASVKTNQVPTVYGLLCGTTSLSWTGFWQGAETTYRHRNICTQCTQEKEHIVPPPKHPATALIHVTQLKLLKVMQRYLLE